MEVNDNRRGVPSIDGLFDEKLVHSVLAGVPDGGESVLPEEDEWVSTSDGPGTYDAYGNLDDGYDDDDDVISDDVLAQILSGESPGGLLDSETIYSGLENPEPADAMPPKSEAVRVEKNEGAESEAPKKKSHKRARSENWKKRKQEKAALDNLIGNIENEDDDVDSADYRQPRRSHNDEEARLARENEQLAAEKVELEQAMQAQAEELAAVKQALQQAQQSAVKVELEEESEPDWELYENAKVVFEGMDAVDADIGNTFGEVPAGYDTSDDYGDDIFDSSGNLTLYDSPYEGDEADYSNDGTFAVPDWVVSLRAKLYASVAHAFLLSGNVRDYMVRDLTIKEGIIQMLDPMFENYDIIAEYDQAHGLTFYGKDIDTTAGCDLATVYRWRFIRRMRIIQKHLSLPVTKDIPNKDTVTLFTIISDMFDHYSEKRPSQILLFVDYSDFLVPDASAAQMKPDERKLAITLSDIGRSAVADETGNCMIFMTDDMTQLSSRIRSTDSRIELVHVPLPTTEERRDFIDNILDVPENTLSEENYGGVQIFQHPETIDKQTLAINTAGLNRVQIENVVLRSLADDMPLSMQLVKDRKNEIILEDYDAVLEIVDSDHGFERVGGMEHLKVLFREEVIEPVHKGEKEAVPMGIMLMGPPGTAKEVAISEFVTRFDTERNIAERVTVGDLVPGDYIYAPDGDAYCVTSVAIKPDKEMYEIELKDGRIVHSSGDHFFEVFEKTHSKWRPKEYSPEQMIAKGLKDTSPSDRKRYQDRESNRCHFHIRQTAALNFPPRELAIDPYIMGVFLGDGCANSYANFELSSTDEELVQEVSSRLNAVEYKKSSNTNHSWFFYSEYSDADSAGGSRKHNRIKISDFDPKYVELLSQTYCGDKYIPEEYKMGSIEQRWELIRGLLDTDGSIDPPREGLYRCNIRFYTTSEQLKNDIMEVVYSLGYSCSCTISKRQEKVVTGSKNKFGKEYRHQSDLYEIRFNIPNEDKPKFFKLGRKKEIAEIAAQHPKKRCYERVPIADIRATGEVVPMRCISISSPDHLFLIGNYIPTHNTFLSRAVAKEANMNFVALNLNRIMEKWVGSTERNLDRALECAMAMAPTIIFIDEIDEALPNRADPNASAVNKRINQRLLTFFSQTEHRGDVIILAATNYPEKVDPAFKRAGRFDIRLPMFAPDDYDRMRIMQVIAKSRGYEFTWFESPDKVIKNPFDRLRTWFEEGNVPSINRYAGERRIWRFATTDYFGKETLHEVYLPTKLINVIDADKITLQQFYETVGILFEDIPTRVADISTYEVDSDEVYFRKIQDYLVEHRDMISDIDRNVNTVFNRIKRFEMIYRQFIRHTRSMTGAEMDVVMNKAINLWKKAQRNDPTIVERYIAANVIKHERDIPWTDFLERACETAISATAGIKLMEDNALLNTSDTDYIPDAMYAETDDGRVISYIERHEELRLAEVKDTIG